MSDKVFIITGAKGGSTAGADAPNRLEINDLVKNEEQFSLYIQSLAVMFSYDQDRLTSFFQIGGIHGLPPVEWNGSGGDAPEGSYNGYCTHGTVLFPTWHRPYVATFEQLLQQHAVEIAKTYTVDRSKWEKAALDLRAPFWDWASNSVPPDAVIADKTITIITPNGKRTSVPNPLFQYNFHPVDKSFPDPFIQWPATLRHPNGTGPNAQTNVKDLKNTLRAEGAQLKHRTYLMMTLLDKWPDFSNHTASQTTKPIPGNSLESIHDTVHVKVGGNGHMSSVPVAGFDPMFWLHHANVDRLLSLWSALHSDVWVTPGDAEDGTWTIPDDATLDDKTDLTPFWDSQNSYWASSMTHVTSKLGYTYPEFNGLDLGNKDAVRAAISRVVNKLYGSFDTFGTVSAAAAPEQSLAAAAPTEVSMASTTTTHHDHTFYDWAARIRVKQELDSSFSVLIFLGEVPNDPADWIVSPTYVGSHDIFLNSSAEHCANCRARANNVIEGFVHLSPSIARLAPHLRSYDPSVVGPYLKENLHWRVRKIDGTVISLQDVPSLEVTVSATPLHHGVTGAPLPFPNRGSEEALPVPGDVSWHHHITRGRQGGVQDA